MKRMWEAMRGVFHLNPPPPVPDEDEDLRDAKRRVQLLDLRAEVLASRRERRVDKSTRGL